MSIIAQPRFHDGCLEFVYDRGEVVIYGNQLGLRKLAELSRSLADELDRCATAHVHLEDYEVLTSHSAIAVLVGIREESK
jgi:hypothetical protein